MKLSLDVFRITLAFDRPYVFLDEDIDEKLPESGFSKPEEGGTVLRISSDGRQSQATRWVDGDVEVYYQPSRAFLSSEGTSPEDVADGFTRIVQVSEDLLGDDWPRRLKWAELYAAARIRGEKSPLKAFSKTYSSKLLDELRNFLSRPIMPSLFGVYAAPENHLDEPLNEIPDWVHIVLEPLVANPQYYFMKVVFREADYDSVEKFAREFESIVEHIIAEVEK